MKSDFSVQTSSASGQPDFPHPPSHGSLRKEDSAVEWRELGENLMETRFLSQRWSCVTLNKGVQRLHLQKTEAGLDDLQGSVDWKNMHKLNVENYVLFDRHTEELRETASQLWRTVLKRSGRSQDIQEFLLKQNKTKNHVVGISKDYC